MLSKKDAIEKEMAASTTDDQPLDENHPPLTRLGVDEPLVDIPCQISRRDHQHRVGGRENHGGGGAQESHAKHDRQVEAANLKHDGLRRRGVEATIRFHEGGIGPVDGGSDHANRGQRGLDRNHAHEHTEYPASCRVGILGGHELLVHATVPTIWRNKGKNKPRVESRPRDPNE